LTRGLKTEILSHQRYCPDCGNNKYVTDPQKGEIVCRRCGFVIQENWLNQTPEWRAFTLNEQQVRTRVGAPTSLLHFDKGLSTTFQPSKDSAGKALPWTQRQKMTRLWKWNNRARMHSKERNLVQAMNELTRLADKLHISRPIVDNAAYLYRRNLTHVRGRSIEGMMAAILYLSCRLTGTPMNLKALTAASSRSRKEITRCYRFLQRDNNLKVPIDSPSQYIPRIASKTKLSQLAQNLAMRIILQAKTKHAVVGKSPLGMAAAALYIAAKTTQETVTQRELADAAEVTEVTVRNRYKNLKQIITS
jgi:transcription initiation factor TFIIB